MKLCIVQPSLNAASETFLRAHAELLPFQTTVVHFSSGLPSINHQPILPQSFFSRGLRKLIREVSNKSWDWEVDSAFIKVFKEKADVVLAEYGTTGTLVCHAAKLAKVPLVVHFHGFDISKHEVVAQHKESFKQLFLQCAGIIGVSNKMVHDLIELGAPKEKIHLNPCGVDTQEFSGANPAKADSVFLSVGRFVEKKAPYLSILAFSQVVSECPQAKLRMIGSGPLIGPCQDLVHVLGLEGSVSFLGACSHQHVKEEMKSARAYIQHSIQASSGDCEGTPVSVMEAQSMGLPVVATKHAGIADVVEHRKTGYLVEEKDVASMAKNMLKFANEPEMAEEMGQAGRKRIEGKFSMKMSIDNLADILKKASIT